MILEWCHALPRDLPNSGTKARPPTFQTDSFDLSYQGNRWSLPINGLLSPLVLWLINKEIFEAYGAETHGQSMAGNYMLL